jgi:hypothetical protein
MNLVIPREARINVVLVLSGATIDVVSDASVKDSGFAGQDVNVKVAHVKAGPSLRSG